jgi:hypothetical protein
MSQLDRWSIQFPTASRFTPRVEKSPRVATVGVAPCLALPLRLQPNSYTICGVRWRIAPHEH